jgi:hypothetical protein
MRKALFFLAAFMVIVATSCSKDSSGSKYGSAAATIDGKNVSLGYAFFATVSGTTSISMVNSLTQTGSSYEALSIVFTGTTVEAKTYNLGFVGTSYSNYIMMSYTTSNAGAYQVYTCNGTTTTGTVTISSVSSSEIKGSYDAEVVSQTDQTAKKTVKGTFTAKFVDVSAGAE